MTPLALISAHFAVTEVTDTDTVRELGGDALTPVELLIEIDEHLNVDLPDGAIGLETTVGEIVAMVETAKREAA